MRILITGGAGFIGRHLVSRLVRDQTHSLVTLDNLSRFSLPPALSAAHSEFVRADVRDDVELRHAMRGCEIVFHLAAEASVMNCERNPEQCFATNVGGTFNVLRSAQESRVRRVVIASSREVYGEVAEIPVPESAPLRPKNHYGASKAAAEMYCSCFAGSGPEITVLRLANVYGRGDVDRVIPRFIDAVLSGSALVLYGGGQVLDFIWVEDVVDAFCAAAFGPCVAGAVNIGSGTGTTIREAAERVLTVCGGRSTIEVRPSRAAEVTKFVADVRRARRELKMRRIGDPLAKLEMLISGVDNAVAS